MKLKKLKLFISPILTIFYEAIKTSYEELINMNIVCIY